MKINNLIILLVVSMIISQRSFSLELKRKSRKQVGDEHQQIKNMKELFMNVKNSNDDKAKTKQIQSIQLKPVAINNKYLTKFVYADKKEKDLKNDMESPRFSSFDKNRNFNLNRFDLNNNFDKFDFG